MILHNDLIVIELYLNDNSIQFSSELRDRTGNGNYIFHAFAYVRQVKLMTINVGTIDNSQLEVVILLDNDMRLNLLTSISYAVSIFIDRL